jgi:hypothetical protein
LAEIAVSRIALTNNAASIWLRACIYYCADRMELCREMLEELERCDVAIADEEISDYLISVWDEQGGIYGHAHPSFYFPVLPAALTGLDRDLRKSPGSYSALGGVDPQSVRMPRRRHGTGDTTGNTASETVHQNPLVTIRLGDDVAEYHVGQAGAVGDGAVANQPVFVQKAADPLVNELPALAAELRALRAAMAREAQTDDQFGSLGEIDAAIGAAEKGDSEETKGRLSQAGGWAVGIATSIGSGLALAALKSALGL